MEANKANELAARWWTLALLSPTFDNGAEGVGAFAGVMMTAINAREPKPSIDKFVKFRRDLLDTLNRTGVYTVYSDYGPDALLHGSMMRAGLECQTPWKTSTSTRDDIPRARMGYGRQESVIDEADLARREAEWGIEYRSPDHV